ncbi:hypothetical protein ACHAWT_006732 [Skeletonema menzelii]
MSETLTGSLDVQRFELREEDVTCCIEQLCCGRSKLIMGEEEVELNKNCWGLYAVAQNVGPTAKWVQLMLATASVLLVLRSVRSWKMVIVNVLGAAARLIR